MSYASQLRLTLWSAKLSAPEVPHETAAWVLLWWWTGYVCGLAPDLVGCQALTCADAAGCCLPRPGQELAFSAGAAVKNLPAMQETQEIWV